MEIGTFIEHSVDHELSGNIIDLCPVGALNSKPFRFRARAWEMTQHPLISPHDGVGTQIYGHVLRGRLMRVVPRENEAINETWIADRDRFSYEGIYAPTRCRQPLMRIRRRAEARVEWDVALDRGAPMGCRRRARRTVPRPRLARPSLQHARGAVPARAPRARPRQRQHRSSAAPARFPRPGSRCAVPGSRPADRRRSIALEALLVVGSNLRHEVPILAHRVRKAASSAARKVALPESGALRIPASRSPRTLLGRQAAWSPSSPPWCAAAPAAPHRRCRAGVRTARA